jgi:hypothetical protein
VFLENQYQVSYVTANLEEAIAVFKEQYGVTKFRILSDGSGPGMHVWTPKGEGEVSVAVAVAKVGDMVIELMEPVSGLDSLYRDAIVPGQPITLHHLAMRCDDVDAMRAESERQGRPVVMAGGTRGLKLIYVDARATLGHYLEYVQFPPETQS